MAEDLYSGWGIRTLSSKNPAYNPLCYQRGSVWPHDNANIAAGFKRYGFTEEAQRVAKGIFDAANCFESYRLPELFSGIERRPYSFPVEYLGANIPQAWAAGSVFMLLNTLLGLEPDAERGVLRISPSLPEWLPEVTLSGMKVGRSRLTVRFRREGSRTRYEVKAVEGKPIQVETV